MTAARAVALLLAVLLVAVPVAGLAIWLAGTRLLGRGRRPDAGPLGDARPFVDLDVSGFATANDIAAYTVRERLFAARVLGDRLAGRVAPATQAAAAPAAAERADREVPVDAFFLVCPACGGPLGRAADVAHYVGSCPTCDRRVTSRRRGSRISLTALDAIRPDPKR